MGSKKISITAIGDILCRSKEIIIEDKLRLNLLSSDLVMGNLEGPETSSTATSQKAGPSLCQIEGTISYLSSLGFDYLSLANNHIMDYKKEGLMDTIRACEKNNILFSGAGRSFIESLRPACFTINNTKISIFSFAETEFGTALDNNYGYAPIDSLEIEKRIIDERKITDLLIIYAHGGIEEVPLPTKYIINKYRHLIDLGVDILIGNHPHVPQGWERRNKSLIFYSLGDFIPDYPYVDFSHDRRWAITVKFKFKNNSVDSFKITPIVREKNQIKIMEYIYAKKCTYLVNKLSNLFSDANLHRQLHDYQIEYLYNNRYLNLLTSIFSINYFYPIKYLLRWLGIPVRNSKSIVDLRRPLLLKLLLRNESHKYVLEEAMKKEDIITETKGNKKVQQLYEELLRGVNNYK